jgi:hypothetical protein
MRANASRMFYSRWFFFGRANGSALTGEARTRNCSKIRERWRGPRPVQRQG